jgi:hypothetical protein
MAQAGTQTVTQVVGHNLGLAVYDLNGTFGAVGYALSATIAQFFVDFYDFPDCLHGALPGMN